MLYYILECSQSSTCIRYVWSNATATCRHTHTPFNRGSEHSRELLGNSFTCPRAFHDCFCISSLLGHSIIAPGIAPGIPSLLGHSITTRAFHHYSEHYACIPSCPGVYRTPLGCIPKHTKSGDDNNDRVLPSDVVVQVSCWLDDSKPRSSILGGAFVLARCNE